MLGAAQGVVVNHFDFDPGYLPIIFDIHKQQPVRCVKNRRNPSLPLWDSDFHDIPKLSNGCANRGWPAKSPNIRIKVCSLQTFINYSIAICMIFSSSRCPPAANALAQKREMPYGDGLDHGRLKFNGIVLANNIYFSVKTERDRKNVP